MKYIYTAIFVPNEDGTKYYCRVPDLPGCITTGSSINDAMLLLLLYQVCYFSAFLKSATYSSCCFFRYDFTKGFMMAFLAVTSSVKSISV